MSHTGITETLKGDVEDPVVIVGLGCRYPNESSSPEAFWELISKARSAFSEVPKARFNIDGYYHPAPDREGGIATKGGYFLNSDPGQFDAPFFSITAYEAASLDPMQRLLLEVVYETMEDAGIPMDKLAGSKTGVYIGCLTKDYEELSSRDINNTNAYQATGGGRSMLSNRLSWFFDLSGPSLTVDTACSSSLYALHMACQSLKLGECESAIVGGCNMILSPDVMHALSYMHFLSPDGKCHSFDHRASGYARGEGFGAVIIKRLSTAIADGDTIRAVIRATGTNQDGHTPGITVPSSTAQAALIQECYDRAGISLHETRYFEAHGTGTAVGDPLELSAIGETFGPGRDPTDPLWVGSVKTNIGHQEGGAGLAGLIKATMSLEKGLIAPLADFEKPNPAFKLEEWKISLPTETIPWPKTGLRRASVNSFGYGGSNAHAILDDALHYLKARGIKANHNTTPSVEEVSDADSDSGFSSAAASDEVASIEEVRKQRLYVFSGLDQAALQRTFESYQTSLQKRVDDESESENADKASAETFVEQLAYTLAHRRTFFNYRGFVVGETLQEVAKQLRDTTPPIQKVSKTDKIVFVFTGQGAQWSQMGRELVRFAQFRDSLARAQDALSALGCEWDVVEELGKRGSASRINAPDFSQPLCTALQLALVDLLQFWGVKPAAVVGHSSGEIAAAYAAGAITHEDAMKIAYHRGCFSAAVHTRQSNVEGAMMAVGLSEQAIQPYLATLRPSSVVVACINSPESITLSGDRDEVDRLEQQLNDEGVFARKLKVTTAYHSHHMECVSDDYRKAMGKIQTSTSSSGVLMFSSVTASLVEPQELDASYWVTNMLKTVRFSEAVEALFNHTEKSRSRRRAAATQYKAIVEVGPHSALKGPMRQILSALENNKAAADTPYTSMLLRGEDADTTALQAAGALWSAGTKIDLALVNVETETRQASLSLANLPTYPWNHSKRMWHESHQSNVRRTLESPRTDLLGVLYDDHNNLEPRWRNVLNTRENPWMVDHKIQSSCLYPAAGMLIMALEAAQKLAEPGRTVKGYEFRDVSFPRALVVPHEGQRREISLHVKPHRIGTRAPTAPWYRYSLYSLTEAGSWSEHSTGLFTIHYDEAATEVDGGAAASSEWEVQTTKYAGVKERASTNLPKRFFYKLMDSIGLQYGPLFQGLDTINIGWGESTGTIKVTDTKSTMPAQFEYPHLIHPSTLDAIFQLMLAAMIECNVTREVFVPVNISKAYIDAKLPQGAGAVYRGYSESALHGNGRFSTGHIVMSDDEWSGPKIVIQDFTATALSAMMVVAVDAAERQRKCTKIDWAEDISFTTSLLKPLSLADEIVPESIQDGTPDEVLAAAIEESMSAALARLGSFESDKLSKHMQEFRDWAVKQNITSFSAVTARIEDLKDVSKSKDEPQTDPEDKKALSEDASEDKPEGPSEDQSGDKPKDETPKENPQLTAIKDFPEFFMEKLTNGVDPAEALNQDLLTALYHTTQSKSDKSDLHLLQLIKAIYHNNPSLTVLLIGNGGVSSALNMAKAFASRPGREDAFQQCVVAEADEAALSRSRQILKESKLKVDFQTIDLNTSLATQEFKSQSFDIIVAAPEIQSGASIDAALVALRDLLRPAGHLILAGPTRAPTKTAFFRGLSESWWNENMSAVTDNSQSTWFMRLAKAGFASQGASVLSPVRGSIIVASTNPPSQERDLDGDEIYILKASSSSPKVDRLADKIIRRLESEGLKGVDVTLDQVDTLSGQSIVSLLDLEKNFVARLSESDFGYLKKMALTALRIMWITQGGQSVHGETVALDQTMTPGLLRTFNAETAAAVTHLDLSHSAVPSADKTVDLVMDLLLQSLVKKPFRDFEYAERDGRLLIPRLLPDESFDAELNIPTAKVLPRQEPLNQPDRPLKLVVGTPGMLDSLRWIDDLSFTATPLGPEEVEIRSVAMPLNFVDIMVAMGQIPTDTLGCEVAGTVTRVGSQVTRFHPGQTLVAATSEAFRTHIKGNQDFFQEVPSHMSPMEAASCVTIYMTAYSGLIDIARLQKGESILIHAAAGGLGQAAIQLSQWIGAEVYVTVGSNAKKQLLMDKYGIPADHIFSSRDLSFAPAVMHATNGRGVDVVLNSLAGEALRQTWLCIADFGRFIEVGKRDIVGNSGLDMAPFLRHITFASVNLEHIGKKNEPLYLRLLNVTFDLLRQGVIGSVHPVTAYSFSEFEKAFRTMQTGKHIGKIVLCVQPDDVVPVLPPKPAQVELDPNGTYVLVGGLGGIGRSIASLMFARGAGHIVFLSRSGARKPEVKKFLDKMLADGKRVDSVICDITDAAQVSAFVAQCAASKWTLKGLIQCAMVLQDVVLENMTYDNWTIATAPKVQGTLNLHHAMPRDLDFFIMLASMSGVLGNPGQANYAAANTFLDSLAHHRRAQGLAGTSLDLGVVQGVGIVADNPEQYEKYDHLTTALLSEKEMHLLLGAAMLGRTADGRPVDAQIVTGVGRDMLCDPVMGRVWSGDAKYAHILAREAGNDAGADSGEMDELKEAIIAAPTLKDAAVLIRDAVVAKMAKALIIEAEDIDIEKPLSTYGVDSLVAVEMRNWVFRELKADVAIFELMAPQPITTLALKVAAKSKLVSVAPTAEELELVGN